MKLYICLFIILFYILVLPWSYIISYFSLALIIYHKVQTWLVENPLEAREFCPVFGQDLIFYCIWYLSSSVFLARIWFLHCMWYLPYSMFLARIWFLQSSLHVISFIFSIFAQGMIPVLPIIVPVIIRISWNIICNIANILQFIISFVCLHIFEALLANYSESAVSGFLRW